jgi:two-component system, LytTR family, response regulator
MRALIVDHEPCVRETLRNLCEADGSIDEVTEAESGVRAIKMIRATQPDLLLLDVDLNDMTGFDVLRSLHNARRPPVIMVTAHEQHAVEAFRIGAIDYLTKPVNADRFATAIKRVHERRKSALVATRGRPASNVQGLIASNCPRRSSPTRLIGENSHRLYFIAVAEVDYIESCGNYVLIHVGTQKYIRRDTVKRLAAELFDAEFEWIRRSTLINLARVAFAERLDHGALAFTFASGARLVSRTGIRLVTTQGRSRIENVE